MGQTGGFSPLALQTFDFVVNGALNHPLGNCVNCVYGNFKNIKRLLVVSVGR